VEQAAKQFTDKLHLCLNDVGAPPTIRERANILSKMLDIPKQQAWNLLEGHQLPDQDLLQKIATEFEVETKWLDGKK
jgi:hypothetical protein